MRPQVTGPPGDVPPIFGRTAFNRAAKAIGMPGLHSHGLRAAAPARGERPMDDEPVFFRAVIRSTSVPGNLPMKVLAAGAESMVTRIPASPEWQTQLREDFRRNRPRDMRRGVAYVSALAASPRRPRRTAV